MEITIVVKRKYRDHVDYWLKKQKKAYSVAFDKGDIFALEANLDIKEIFRLGQEMGDRAFIQAHPLDLLTSRRRHIY